MNASVRFGRKLAVPSTAEIKHELRMMAAADALFDAEQTISLRHVVGDLAVKHNISRARAQMLVDRFGTNRASLESAAQDLRMSKS